MGRASRMATKYAASLLTAEVQGANVQRRVASPSAAKRRPEGALSVIEERDELWDDDEVSVASADSEASTGSGLAGFVAVLCGRLARRYRPKV
mmetsp:Transcript_43327/g.100347  ORF Transcript_43327/g.100347 Transcript_43327/m.100347 type:complete len:93 (+) Transcript_43327:116-394(+)